MRRFPPAVLLALGLLASCGPAPRRDTPLAATSAGAVCRVGPGGVPPLADRGIGGTGISAGGARPADTNGLARAADRGIGGTGRLADRGIGGTGIVGVITGFASICVNGLEVGADSSVPVLVDGEPASAAVLRAGQVVAIEAGDTGAALQAGRVLVRHEVSGPVEAVGPDGSLRVAGQEVAMGQKVAMGQGVLGGAPERGDWVEVSGLRRPGGDILATRIDRRAPGSLLVRGRLERKSGGWRIGGLHVRVPAGLAGIASAGSYAAVTGRWDGGALAADTISPDLLAANPAALFGPGIERFVIEGYASAADGALRLGTGLEIAARPELRAAPGWAIIEMRRRDDGALLATGLRGVSSDGSAPSPALDDGGTRPDSGHGMMEPPRRSTTGSRPALEPAPVPSRGLLQEGGAASGGAGLSLSGGPVSPRAGAGWGIPNGGLPGTGGPDLPGGIGSGQPGTNDIMPGAGPPGPGEAPPSFGMHGR